MHRAWLSMSLVSSLLGGLGAGCGSKTGLIVPDASPELEADAAKELPITQCIEVPVSPDAGPVRVPLTLEARLRKADVLFLIDVTSSMGAEIERIQGTLRDRLAPAIVETIPDAFLGVATFADFPVEPYGSFRDVPFELLSRMTSDLSQAQAGVNAAGLRFGLDEPESQVEALYQVATGAGIGDYVPASFGCPSGGFGYPCFRDDALPIVLLFSDAPFHMGVHPEHAYARGAIHPAPHDLEETLLALRNRGIRVLGFDSGAGSSRADLENIAIETNAIDMNFQPLVYDIGTEGQRLDTSVVNAITVFADSVIFDVDAVARDVDFEDGVAPSDFIARIRPISAEPMNKIEAIDSENDRFLRVRSGTSLVFEIVILPGLRVQAREPRRFDFDIVFRGDEATFLGSKRITLVIPGLDGDGC